MKTARDKTHAYYPNVFPRRWKIFPLTAMSAQLRGISRGLSASMISRALYLSLQETYNHSNPSFALKVDERQSRRLRIAYFALNVQLLYREISVKKLDNAEVERAE